MYLIFRIGVVLVYRSQKMVPLEKRPDIAALPRGEGHGGSVKRVKLMANRFMKEQENQNRRHRLRASQTSFGGGRRRRIDFGH